MEGSESPGGWGGFVEPPYGPDAARGSGVRDGRLLRTSRLQKQHIFFCLFPLRRSRTESARGRGCLASEFVCQAVSPRGRTDARLQPRSLQLWERPGNGDAALCTEPRRPPPLTPIHGRAADRLSATSAHAGDVSVYRFSDEYPQFRQLFGLLRRSCAGAPLFKCGGV